MSGRRKARVAALQLLFQKDLVTDVTTETTESMLEELLPDPEQRKFAWQLYAGTWDNRAKIDKAIQAVAQNWRIGRMAATDRNVIRMGAYEMEFIRTEPAIVIDECVEIAREYGLPQSGQFVNGILDKLKPKDAVSAPEPKIDASERCDNVTADKVESCASELVNDSHEMTDEDENDDA